MSAEHIFYKLAKPIAVPIVRTFRPFQIHFENEIISEGGVVLISNHIHTFDPIIIAASTHRYIRFISKESSFHNPLYLLLKPAGVIPVFRDTEMEKVREIKPGEITSLEENEYIYQNILRNYTHLNLAEGQLETNMDSLNMAIDYAKQGEAVGIFPEGHRTDLVEKLAPFKPGFVIIAKKAGVPIQPVGMYEENSMTHLVIGEPIYISRTNSTKAIVKEAEQKIKRLVRL